MSEEQNKTGEALQAVEELLPRWQRNYAAYLRVVSAAEGDERPLLEMIVRGEGGKPAKAVIDLDTLEDAAEYDQWLSVLQQYFYADWRNVTRKLAVAFSKLERSLQQGEAEQEVVSHNRL